MTNGMTWSSFLNLSTMGHRHLVFVYFGVWAVQGTYLAWLIWSWNRTKSPRL